MKNGTLNTSNFRKTIFHNFLSTPCITLKSAVRSFCFRNLCISVSPSLQETESSWPSVVLVGNSIWHLPLQKIRYSVTYLTFISAWTTAMFEIRSKVDFENDIPLFFRQKWWILRREFEIERSHDVQQLVIFGSPVWS